MKAIYPDNGEGDREAHSEAVPGLRPETKGTADVTSLTLEVDGEMFALRPNEFGGTDYAWLNGPNPGYGFGASPTMDLSLDEHMENIRGFLAIVDPTIGYVEDNRAVGPFDVAVHKARTSARPRAGTRGQRQRARRLPRV